MQLRDLRVLVAGGGTGGCAAALLLARAGASVSVIERVAQPRAVGAGLALAANGLAVLESLGLAPALARGCPAVDARITDERGTTLLPSPPDAPVPVLVRRATLQGVLLDALAAEPRISSQFGVEVRHVAPDGTVELQEGDRRSTTRADLVIGADGVHSRVREGGAFGARVAGRGIHYVRTLVTTGTATGTEAWTALGIFGAFAVDGGTYCFMSCGSPVLREALARRDLDAFRQAWAQAYPPARALLAGVAGFDDLLGNEVIEVRCTRWHDGRVALLGDAAHAMAPNLGQGANSALVDAAVLLHELRHADSLEEALVAYERRRQPAVARVATAAARLGALGEVTHPLGRAARAALLRVVARLPLKGATAAVLQEPAETLLAIGRA